MYHFWLIIQDSLWLTNQSYSHTPTVICDAWDLLGSHVSVACLVNWYILVLYSVFLLILIVMIVMYYFLRLMHNSPLPMELKPLWCQVCSRDRGSGIVPEP